MSLALYLPMLLLLRHRPVFSTGFWWCQLGIGLHVSWCLFNSGGIAIFPSLLFGFDRDLRWVLLFLSGLSLFAIGRKLHSLLAMFDLAFADNFSPLCHRWSFAIVIIALQFFFEVRLLAASSSIAKFPFWFSFSTFIMLVRLTGLMVVAWGYKFLTTHAILDFTFFFLGHFFLMFFRDFVYRFHVFVVFFARILRIVRSLPFLFFGCIGTFESCPISACAICLVLLELLCGRKNVIRLICLVPLLLFVLFVGGFLLLLLVLILFVVCCFCCGRYCWCRFWCCCCCSCCFSFVFFLLLLVFLLSLLWCCRCCCCCC